jgi:hypothetical protein
MHIRLLSQKSIKMSAVKNMSLFIPHVFPSFTEEYVELAFEEVGDVDRVDFVAKQDRDGKHFNAVYVHFKKWHNNSYTSEIQASIAKNGSTKFYHSDTWYWIVLPNTTKKHTSGADRKPRIDIGEDKVINVKSVEETPKPVAPTASKSSWAEREKKRKDDIVDKVLDHKDENSTKIKNIVRIILDSEYDLSDGFGYYGNVEKTLGDIAKKILATLDDELTDEQVQPYSHEEAEMDDIEAELEADDENLVSVDWRYIKTIEEENMFLHCEIAQLRQAAINLDQMYQAETAKVRALSQQPVIGEKEVDL